MLAAAAEMARGAQLNGERARGSGERRNGNASFVAAAAFRDRAFSRFPILLRRSTGPRSVALQKLIGNRGLRLENNVKNHSTEKLLLPSSHRVPPRPAFVSRLAQLAPAVSHASPALLPRIRLATSCVLAYQILFRRRLRSRDSLPSLADRTSAHEEGRSSSAGIERTKRPRRRKRVCHSGRELLEGRGERYDSARVRRGGDCSEENYVRTCYFLVMRFSASTLTEWLRHSVIAVLRSSS